MIARTYEHGWEPSDITDRRIDRQRHAVAGRNSPTIERDEQPMIESPAPILIRYAQRFDCRDEGIDWELRQQQKAVANGLVISIC
jgi:hypothetical protein